MTQLIIRPLKERIELFFNMKQPCDFPGCQDLRIRYARELRKSVKGCSSCHRMAVHRKYQALVKGRLGA